MRKPFIQIVLISLLILGIKSTNAQWTVGSPPYLYTTTNNVGIGTATPSFKVEVSGGSINIISTGSESYMINGLPVLWHNANINNIFVGVEAGNSISTGTANTFMGYRAGASNTEADGNTLVGEYAGELTVADKNSFFGWHSGISNENGERNVFIGALAGRDNEDGTGNVFVGNNAGEWNVDGQYNVAIGNAAGGGFVTSTSGSVSIGFAAVELEVTTMFFLE